jgi:hypothetical protein
MQVLLFQEYLVITHKLYNSESMESILVTWIENHVKTSNLHTSWL